MTWPRAVFVPLLIGLLLPTLACRAPVNADQTTIPVIFSGGHNTEPEDHGRPVVLVAAALGVKPEVFRAAFRGVTPARDGKPSGDEARHNKAVLMDALGPYGITNERLDEVSDYYRYNPGRGGLWRTSQAKAYAVVEAGTIKKIVLTNSGSGFTTPPKAIARGMEHAPLKVTLHFGKEFDNNGSIESVELAVPAAEK